MTRTGRFRTLIRSALILILGAGFAYAQTTATSVVTTEAVSITANSAVLNGTIIPGGTTAAAWFEWGTTTALGTRTETQLVGDGTTIVALTHTLRNLQPRTTYYFRAVGYRPAAGTGNVLGEVRTFTTTGDVSTTPGLTLTTGEVTSVTSTSAMLNGVFNPGGAGTVWFEWGTTTSLGTRTDVQTWERIVPVNIAHTLRNLQPHTLYYYRAVAYRSSDGATALGEVRSFTTSDTAVISALTVTTGEPTSVTSSSAVLNGTVNSGGTLAAGWFEWGTTTSLGTRTETRTFDSSGAVELTFSLGRLQPRTTYFFRMVGYRPGGNNVAGDVRSFTTTSETPGGLSITSSEATEVTSTSVVLRATLSSGGTGTVAVWFEWAPSTNTASSNVTETQRLAAGETRFTQSLGNLQPRTAYYFRAVASIGETTIRGAINTFTTLSDAPAALSVTTNEAGALSSSSAELRGAINPGGIDATAWFEWGPTTTLTNQTTAQSAGSGTAQYNYAYPLTNLQANTTYYFRAVGQNTGGRAARGDVRSFTTPRVVSTEPGTITDVERGVIRSGYVIITPDASSGAPTPTVTFGTVSGGSVQTQAGIVPESMTTAASMFVEIIPSISRNIGVALANPGAATNVITLRLRDENGFTVGTPVNVSLEPRQQVAKFVDELFGAAIIGSGFRGSLYMQSATPFAALALRFSRSLFSTLAVAVTAPVPGVPSRTLTAGATSNSPQAGTAGGSTALIIPQFVIGAGWASQIALVNDTSATVVGRVDVFDTSGNPLAVNMNGETRSTFTYSIPVGGTFVLGPRDENGQSPL